MAFKFQKASFHSKNASKNFQIGIATRSMY